MEKVLCDEVMTKDVASVAPDVSARGAARLMAEQHVGSLPVVGEGRKLIGIITDRDLVIRVMAPGHDPEATQVDSIMSTDLVTCYPNDEIEEATDRMMNYQVRRLYIVDRDGILVGVIAQADIANRAGDRIRTAQLVERVSQADAPKPVPGGMG